MINNKFLIKKKDVFLDIKTYKDFTFNTIFCDPPYNLGSKWKIDKSGRPVIKNSKDFMDKWNTLNENGLDTFFLESFRVLKYGGYLLMFGMDRQMMPFQYYAVKNGFEITQGLAWYYISNFPKATDVSKMIDKRLGKKREKIQTGNTLADMRKNNYMNSQKKDRLIEYKEKSSSNLAKQFDKYKYSIAPLKQCLEYIMVFRKPTKNKSVLDDIFEWDKGNQDISPSVLNIEDGRVPAKKGEYDIRHYQNEDCFQNLKPKKSKFVIKEQPSNRYPAQMFISEEVSKVIDKQSGILISGDKLLHHKKGLKFNTQTYSKSKTIDNVICLGDSGGASRILHNCKYEQEEIDLVKYCSKVNNNERNYGLAINNHPTVKPIKLCYHIMQLFKLPNEVNQKIYVPFCGTGSEIIGMIFAGIARKNIIGCENNLDYIKICRKRIKSYTELYKKGTRINDLKKQVIIRKKIKYDN